MTILSKEKILTAMRRPLKDRLVVTPLLDVDLQVKDGAIDLRLGNEFIVPGRTSLPTIDLKDRQTLKEENITSTKIKFRESFLLPPRQLVLASTWEYLALPSDLSGYVIGRSSWGRLGLIIATATFVNSGYKGCLTLELVNLGEVPLALYPGLRVAQLILHQMEGQGEYSGRYRTPVAPEASKIYDDTEVDFWCLHSSPLS